MGIEIFHDPVFIFLICTDLEDDLREGGDDDSGDLEKDVSIHITDLPPYR